MADVSFPREVPLDRRICKIWPDHIDIRPSRGALIGPLLGLAVGLAMLGTIAAFHDSLPVLALTALLLPALIITPLSAMGAVYSIVGSHIIFERQKQSGRFQQGMIGLGLGTDELVPFWKIERIELADYDLGETYVRGAPSPLDMVAWEVILVKVSGKRLSIGQVLAPDNDELALEGFNRAYDVGEAVATLVEKPFVVTAAVEEPAPNLSPAEPKAQG
ncbi:MAG TPA: hypothetical protein VFB90_07605 [Dehalococcoidia bacterium]|nr:hypothetical protein [Dehalococcoidia bacterium]